MKKIILLLLLACSLNQLQAQDYLGLSTGNYAGVHGLFLQPANAADNRFKLDVNLVSTSFNFQNNFVGLTRDYFVNNRFSFKDFENYDDFKQKVMRKNDVSGNNVYLNINNRLNLPSILLTTGKKSGIALNFQSRTSIAVNNLNPDLAEQAYEEWKNTPTQGTPYNANGLDISALNWFEGGLTYGRVLVDNDKHFFKAGVTGKYLGGISSWYFKADDLTVTARQDSLIDVQANNVKYGHSATNITSQISRDYRPDASAIGYDVGLVYEFRGRSDKFKFLKFDRKDEEVVSSTRRDKNKYTLKLGVSLLDVGVLKFKSTPLARDFSANVNGLNLNTIMVNNVPEFDTTLNNINGVNFTGTAGEEYSVALPTALSAQLDWHLFKGFYVNAMAYMPFSGLNKNADYRVFTPNYYAVTPRWESRLAGVYVPIVMNNYKNAENNISAGATVRLGPLFVGTSNILTLLKQDNIQRADVHAGLKVPLAFGKPSKATRWFKDMTTSKEIETKTVEKTVIVKDEAGNDVEKKVIVEERVNNKVEEKVEEKSTPQQPIQIIINNYNNGEGSNKRQTIDVDPVTGKTSERTIMVDENGNEVDVQSTDMNNLQDQIEYLKFKLKQKQQLIDEIENQKNEIQNGTYNEESKKKIKELKEAYLFDNSFTPSGAQLDYSNRSASFMRTQLFNLQKEILDLDNDNTSLDRKMAVLTSDTESLIEENKSNKAVATYYQDLNSDLTEVRTMGPKEMKGPAIKEVARYHPSYDNSINPVGVKVDVDPKKVNTPIRRENLEPIRSYSTAPVQYNIDTNSLMTKTDAQNLMTKSEYQNLRKEMVLLKEEVKNTQRAERPRRRWSLFGNGGNRTTINIDSSRNIVQDVKIVRDTIYVDRPVERIVTKIVRDTITNTIEKNNIITKTETKVEKVEVDNTVDNLLGLPPLYVLFDLGKFYIKPVYTNKLSFYTEQLKKYPNLKVQLTGHTDNSGNAAKNLILSKNRAKAVSNYLVSKGVSRDRIITVGLGSNDPLADNKSASGKSQNRRVELQFIK